MTQVIEVREQLGGFSMPGELTALAGLSTQAVSWIQDRVIFLPY